MDPTQAWTMVYLYPIFTSSYVTHGLFPLEWMIDDKRLPLIVRTKSRFPHCSLFERIVAVTVSVAGSMIHPTCGKEHSVQGKKMVQIFPLTLAMDGLTV